MRAIHTASLTLLPVVAFGLAGPPPAVADGYTLTALASFNGSNGAQPNESGLMRDTQGNLFGTTEAGGAFGRGTVFEIAAGSNTITTLAPFNGANGAAPRGGLLLNAQGNLFFGTTQSGGANNNGTVFEIAAGSNTITTLASFNGANGTSPSGSLVRDAQGNLFGTTQFGGANDAGTVFEIAAGIRFPTTLASFNFFNGFQPVGGLIRDAQGNLYGATNQGGSNNNGTVFEIAAGSGTITTLATFDRPGSLVFPSGPVVRDAQGNLFGTTQFGGAFGRGMVFEIAAGSSILTTLASFNGADGNAPGAGLLRDAQGNLFGTTFFGGAFDRGTVFEIAAGSNTITTLASFNGANGSDPGGGLLPDAQGNLFGTAAGGGAFNQGAVFELSPVPEPTSLVLMGLGLVGVASLALRIARGGTAVAGAINE